MTNETRTIHAIESGITVAGYVLRRGETIALTAAQVDDTRDKFGDSWLDQTEDDQIARWGSVKFGLGEAPDDMHAWQDDTLARAGARDAEREDALRIVDRTERIKALAAIDEKYGRPATQWSLGSTPAGS